MVILLVSGSLEASQLARDLRAVGHTVHRAGTGVGAIAAVLASGIDVVICDLDLPDMSGMDVVLAFRTQSPGLPIIGLGGGPVDKVEPSELVRVLKKPVPSEDVIAELQLVARGRTQLSVVLLDPEAIHAARVSNALADLGCEVHRCADIGTARGFLDNTGPSLLLIDVHVEGAAELTAWAQTKKIVVVAFVGPGGRLSQDELLRLGTALVMKKPIDCDALMTQVRFLALA